MNKIVKFAVFSSVLSFSSLCIAQSISTTSDTLENAEHNISLKAHKQGAKSYKITEAHVDNNVHMTAELIY